ncbi:MAG: YsnF/AvaK domain-containing protein, partial [Thermomicrobia bacterium]|nr:YsnF/AvaK domain-containing protein [Thermomicrobia bacterium]
IADERGVAGGQRNDERLARREAGRDYRRDDKNITVPIVEEQLKAGVREKDAGSARIVKDVVEEQKTINVPVEREEVYVTERAVNRPATQADLAGRDREVEVPLREQEVVVQKQAVVTGEVNVRKETVTETERVTDTVRREDVHVEGADSARVHTEGTERRGNTGAGAGKTVTDKREYDSKGDLVDREHYEEPGTGRSR